MERPNTIAGLEAKRAELIKLRDQLEADLRAVTVDLDHLARLIHGGSETGLADVA